LIPSEKYIKITFMTYIESATTMNMLAYEQNKGFNLLLPYQEKPLDRVSVVDSHAEGEISYFTHNQSGWKLESKKFSAKIIVPLSPFTYKKPEVSGNPFNPEEKWENKEREGYYPLTIVENGLRGPNHWHREDSALVCGVRVKDHWETRYFPRQNIPESTWAEATKLLSSN
jgi:hypothetical protein